MDECSHILKVWHEVPHPRYGAARPHFIALPTRCALRAGHAGEHRAHDRWR